VFPLSPVLRRWPALSRFLAGLQSRAPREA
jgi:hypothetical protein